MLRRAALAAGSLALAAACLAAVISAGKQDPGRVPSVSEVASRVMSPFCPGLSLDECPSRQAVELRARIDRRIAAGSTNSEIDRWLVSDYGESVLARPPGAAAWLAPAGFVLAGLAFLVGFLGRQGRRVFSGAEPDAGAPPAPAASPERARMLEDLSRFAESTE